MTELRQALAEIRAIRTHVARGTQFRGYGPRSIAASGVLALGVAAVQAHWFSGAGHDLSEFLVVWVATAALSVFMSAWETVTRARRVHDGFAKEMTHAAVEQFLPAVVAGVLLTVVLVRTAPEVTWMLPGLWELIFSLGIFASCRFLPRRIFGVGLWYLAAGLACLAVESGQQTLSPWAMGVPFGVGQLLVASVLQSGYGDCVAEG
ncbi:MAG: hypothetical protein JWO04_2464 [Gammaproteobacteria bacterium]|jgi:hypothetical protein|nr:hypothetical protein [Gammaproteobacteria bacterium]